ncbi:MAG: hypothetical protein ACFCBU_13065, partial [Cyanophyceae cyanobacterium]
MAQRIGFPFNQAFNNRAPQSQAFQNQASESQASESQAPAQAPFQSLAQYLGQYLGQRSSQCSSQYPSQHSSYWTQPVSRSPQSKNPALPISMGHWFGDGEPDRRPRRQVAFVDRTVDDYVLLLSGIPSSIPVVLLDS